jgi:hypothetical protein
MTTFLFVYRHRTDTFGKMTPEEMQHHMRKWHAWMNEGSQKGWLVNAGNGLKKDGRVVNGNQVVTDGPFVEAEETVGAFSII